MSALLLELFSEEIPARMQARAADDLQRLVTAALKDAGLQSSSATALYTPRRLTLHLEGLPSRQPDRSEERKGPRTSAPDKALEGFLRANGAVRDDLEIRDTGKGEFYFLTLKHEGRPTVDVLAEILPGVLQNFPWPKSQRWGDYAIRWVRPLRSILCLFDGRVVPFAFGHLRAGNVTQGHRFMAPDVLEIGDFADYRRKLQDAFVIADAGERRELIGSRAAKLAAEKGLRLREDPSLLAEVANLVEWPEVLMGAFDPAFMAVPHEVLTATMRANQKYFSLLNEKGELAPHFVVVANLKARDGGDAIVRGNERVLRARLDDARFFWDQDRRQRLEDRLPALKNVVFHARLGSLGDKAVRLQKLSEAIGARVPGCAGNLAARAGLLAKADLVTGMVGEFPEVQGIMGRYYALNDGEDPAVADAIGDQYRPQGPGDACPDAPVSVALALADKIDNLTGFFAIGEKPTGSKDPFALRRAALGVIRLVLENRLILPLKEIVAAAWDIYGCPGEDPAPSLIAFIGERLKVHLRDAGIAHDHVAAVMAAGETDDILSIGDRAGALRDFLGSDDGANLLVAYRRAANILRIEEKKDDTRYHGPAASDLFAAGEEAALARALRQSDVGAAIRDRDYSGAMGALAELRAPVDSFFEHVTVNADDPALRANRLRLLAEIRDVLHQVADFSKIEG